MTAVPSITIVEAAPCADLIYHIRLDPEEGYSGIEDGLITLRSGAKLRPRIVSTYAGGKATNVARILDSLLTPDDKVRVELIVFRPDNPVGRLINDLLASTLERVEVNSVLIKGTARLCIDLSDPTSAPADRVDFNISPRVLWEAESFDQASSVLGKVEAGLLLVAGNPPARTETQRVDAGFYARAIDGLKRVKDVSADVERETLQRCLTASSPPSVIKINRAEYESIASVHWNLFEGTLVVTDRDGCDVYEAGVKARPVRVRGARVENVYSTIGAGDAVHAGFTLARWVWGFDPIAAARYGMAAAAAAVSSASGTQSITRDRVDAIYNGM
jgi:fructose-1-phosphate kinase PfkB-like protein